MNFITFPVSGTNIFPLSNSKAGGQLVTEWNLRSREMVGTSASIKYDVGPSFVHSEEDFAIRLQTDDGTTYTQSQHVIEVLPGRAVVNGHFVQTHVPMYIDMLEANAKLQSQAQKPMKGQLEIGIRAYYSTEPTLAGTMLVENKDDMYIGIQLVVMSKEDGGLVLPSDSPTDINKVNAHVRLGSFTFLNGVITGVKSATHEEKCRYISADRIYDINNVISDAYITRTGMQSNRFYMFASKGDNIGTAANPSYSTWCDATGSTMLWDRNPQQTSQPSAYAEAQFDIDGVTGEVGLVVPHKHFPDTVDADGNLVHGAHFEDKVYKIPVADFSQNTPGTVDSKYTRSIKAISEKLDQFYNLSKGKQVHYIAKKDADTKLPEINAAWNYGDYVLVGEDYTADAETDGVRAPVTMYVVLPGVVRTIKYVCKESGSIQNPVQIPASLTGAQLGLITVHEGDTFDATEVTTTDGYPTFFTEEDIVIGAPGVDYFALEYWYPAEKDENNVLKKDESGNLIQSYDKYFYAVETCGKRQYSKALPLTGEIPFAQEDVIGGFYNASADSAVFSDAGYVYRDENGHLRLRDYALLRSGTLAYQLGEDITFPQGYSTEEVQNYLDEYVNERVAFPNAKQLAKENPNIINLYISLTAEESPHTLTIRDIDSRFNAAVHIHILGDANSNTTINIIDCERIKIDNDIAGTPIINVYRSCLYYDAPLFNYIRSCTRDTTSYALTFTGFDDLRLWYSRLSTSDPSLVVDGMTVSELDAPVISQEVDFWTTSELNDTHYRYALHSVTFSSVGDIVKCEMLISNQSTNNIDIGKRIITSTFELPQGSGLAYPKTCMNKPLKITGTFVSAYAADGLWRVTDTHFTAVTSTYSVYDSTETTSGTISLLSNTELLQASLSGKAFIEGWEPNSYHIFAGGVIG